MEKAAAVQKPAEKPPASASGGRGPASWPLTRTLVMGGGVFMLAALLLHTGGKPSLLFSEQAMLPLVLTLVGLGLVIGVDRPWALLTAGIVISVFPILGIAVFGFVLPALALPQAYGDFVGSLYILVTLLLALPAGIIGFIQSRKGAPQIMTRGSTGTPYGTAILALVAVVFGATLTSSLAGMAATSGPDAAGYDNILAEATAAFSVVDSKFPATMSVPSGRVLEITVENKDSFYHTFTYKVGDKEFSHHLFADDSTKFLTKFDAAGTFDVRCVPHSTGYAEGMVGKIVAT